MTKQNKENKKKECTLYEWLAIKWTNVFTINSHCILLHLFSSKLPNIIYNFLLALWPEFYIRILQWMFMLTVIWAFTHSTDCLYANEFPELPLDGLWLVPGVSAVHLSTPEILSVSLSAGRPSHPRSVTFANLLGWIILLPRTHNKFLTDSWHLARIDTFKKAFLSKLYYMVMSSWTKLWAVSQGSDTVSVPRRLCLQVSQAALPQECPSAAPVWSPHFVSTVSYGSPITRHHTSWLFSPLSLFFVSIPTLLCWRGTLNAFNVALAPCSSPLSVWFGSNRSLLHLGWLIAGMPSASTLHVSTLLDGQHSIS